MPTIIDDFSVGNHTNLDGQLSSDGTFVWEALESSGVAVMRTSTSAFCDAVIAFSERCVYRAELDFTSPNHYVQAVLRTTNTSMYPGLAVRKDSSATMTYYDVQLRTDDDVVRIRKRVAGTFTTLQNTAHVMAIDTDYLVKLEVEGTTIRVFVDGVQIGADLIDSSIVAGTRCCMVAEIGGSTAKTAQFKTFEGSDGASFIGTFGDAGEGIDRVDYTLTPVFTQSLREAGAATERIEYDLVDTITAVVRETGAALDRIVGTLADVTSATVREAAEGTDANGVSRSRISGDVQVPYGPSMVIITHIYDYFGTGLDWAFSDVRRPAPAHDHAGKVLTWGSSTREIPIPPGGAPRLGRMVIEFDDTPDPVTGVQFFRSQFGARTPKGKRVDLKIGPADGKESLFQIPAAGVIEHATFPPGKMRLEVPDVRYKWLQKPLPGLINDTNFDSLPAGVKEAFFPFVLGEVSSVGFGAQGAISLPHVDTVLHRYAASRAPIEAATVYTKEPDEQAFTEAVATWSLVQEETVIDGLTYQLTYVQFDSALPDGTEVRADIEGLNEYGGWGTVPSASGVSDNVIDHAFSVFYYVDALEKGRVRTIGEAFATWDLPSMATVREQFEVAGYSSAYAITEPVTPEVILTHLFSTFCIHWFPSRIDKTKVVMTTVETPDDAPIFGDFHSILLNSDMPELSRDTRNRIHYSFGRIHGLPGIEFAGHDVYTNEGDQTQLTDSDGEPIIEAETIDLHACRDADVAQLLAVEWGAWRDQDAHRFRFELDMPTKLSSVDLAKDFLVTHYGGLAEGGWSRVRFIPYRITDDYDRMKFVIEAIRRVSVPAIESQPQARGEWRINSRVGPYYYTGNKTLFQCFADSDADLKKLVIIATVNG